MSCYRQTCTQTITGRYLEYWRALKVIQNEEYLMVTDLDIIQRLHKGGGIQVNSFPELQKLIGPYFTRSFRALCGTHFSAQFTPSASYALIKTWADGSFVLQQSLT